MYIINNNFKKKYISGSVLYIIFFDKIFRCLNISLFNILNHIIIKILIIIIIIILKFKEEEEEAEVK